jgi:hypothetical protein
MSLTACTTMAEIQRANSVNILSGVFYKITIDSQSVSAIIAARQMIEGFANTIDHQASVDAGPSHPIFAPLHFAPGQIDTSRGMTREGVKNTLY